MKKFIIKTCFFLLPIILIGIIIELSLRHIPNDYSYKNEFLQKYSNKVEVLFLGSSHTYYGVNPVFISKKSFNASHISQSIDYDFSILTKFDNNWGKLKCIVLPIDYFTLYSRVSTGKEPWRVKNYEIYYNINKSNKIEDHFEILSIKTSLNIERIYSYYIKHLTAITCSELGFGVNKNKNQDLNKSGVEAAKRHTKMDMHYFEQNKIILEQLIEFSVKHHIQIVFYTSPAFKTYFTHLNKKQQQLTTNFINKTIVSHPNCSYHNFLEDSSFISEDFYDADHLNESGAKKLSLKLNDLINAL